MRLLLTLCCLLLATPAWADTYYVRAGAGGAGATWTAALSDLPSSFSAGDTYYVAEGSYSGRTINAANVTIRRCVDSARATQACQGVSGWQDSYGDGQASIGGVTIGANGITLDGVVRNESSWNTSSAYGFTGTVTTATVARDTGTVQYMYLPGTDSLYVVAYTGGTSDGWLVERNYFIGASQYTAIYFLNVTTTTVQYNYFGPGEGKEAIRGLSMNTTVIRYNKFYDACGMSGGVGEGCSAEIANWTGSADGNEVYGNWFYRTRDENSGGTIVIGGDYNLTWDGPPGNNNLVYNNTFAGYAGGDKVGRILINGGSGNICRNNLWYNTPSTNVTCNTTSNNVVAGSNPFVNYAGADLHLTGATAAGYTLSSPYNVDMDGVTRAVDGTWDVGAYEYGTGGTPQTYQQSVSDSLSPTEGGVQYQYQGPAPTIRRGVTMQ